MTKPKDPKPIPSADPAELTPDETAVEAAPETEAQAETENALPDAEKADSEPETDSGEIEGGADEQADGEQADGDAESRELHHGDHSRDDHHHEDDHGQRSLAATALMILVGVIVISTLTLWAAPKLAPRLPAGIAKYLLPGQMETEGRLSELDEALAAEKKRSEAAIAVLKADFSALSKRLDEAAANAASGETEAALADAQSAAAALAARMDTVDTELSSLRGEFGAVSTALADAGSGEAAAAPELAAAIAALGARLDNLSETVSGGSAERADIAARLDAVESSAADARNTQSEALGEVSSAIQQARLQSAADLLTSRLTGGLPYAAKLTEIAALTGETPPEALAAGAETGLATAASLEASFSRHAQAAVAADIQASTGDGTGLQALGWLRAQVAGRPVTEQQGDGVGATTSRIAARVEEGALAEALAEAETLPEHAQAGLGQWLERLRARVAAETALADWRVLIGADG